MSPRTAMQNREVRAVTRAKLLNAALELFAARGYAATSVDAIADEAGVSAGLLYHHFDSKAAVLNAIFEQSLADVQATFAAADREARRARSLARRSCDSAARDRAAASPVLGGVVRAADAAGRAEERSARRSLNSRSDRAHARAISRGHRVARAGDRSAVAVRADRRPLPALRARSARTIRSSR